MTEKPTDLRIIKTRAALEDALLDLLNEYSLEDIKVIDICQRARVHRTTFYKHFEDKYHLLNYLVNDTISGFTDKLAPVSEYSTPEEFYGELLKSVIAYLHSERERFNLIIKNNSSGLFTYSLQEIICARIYEYLCYFAKKGYAFSVPLNIIAQYRSGGVIFASRYLLQNGSEYSTDEVYNYMMTLFCQPIYHNKP